MNAAGLAVLKFGSSVLGSESDVPVVVEEIAGFLRRDWRVVAVVSAIGDGTDRLIAAARAVAPAERRSTDAESAFAALLGTGEAASAALIALALDHGGVASAVLDVGRVGPFTRGPRLDATPHAFDTASVRHALDERPVAILPGFVGRDERGRHTLLGRGGSDLTSLFVARALRADRCRLLKDVDGVYEHDPALRGLPAPRRFATLDWEGALRLEDCILQQKAVQFAYRHRLQFEVSACAATGGTVVGALRSRFATNLRGERTRRRRPGSSMPAKPGKHAKPTKSAKPASATKPAKSARSANLAKPAKSAGQVKPARKVKPAEPAVSGPVAVVGSRAGSRESLSPAGTEGGPAS